jgi:hypothetical protein
MTQGERSSAVTALLEAMRGSVPVFLTSETTGVRDSDVLTCISIAPICGSKVEFLFEVPEEYAAKAAKFLGLPQAAHATEPKTPLEDLGSIFDAIRNTGRTQMISVLTYNVPFQRRYLPANVSDRIGGMLDLTRFAWCLRNAPALDSLVREGMTLDEIDQVVQSLTIRVDGCGYKQVFFDWNVQFSEPICYDKKPRLLESLLLRVLGVSKAYDKANVELSRELDCPVNLSLHH